ncbi:unnamed protein product [Absidia cylindrospora]
MTLILLLNLIVTFAPAYPGIVGVLQGHNRIIKDGSSTLVLLDDLVYSKEALFDTLGSIRFALNAGVLRDVAPIVYSSSKSTDYMQECLNHGAVHYILKPLREDVVHTLFLNVTRLGTHQQQLNGNQGPLSRATEDSAISNEHQGKMWKAFQRRLQSVFEVNHNLIHQSISEYFHPDIKISLSGLKSISSETNTQLRTQISSWGFAPFDYNYYELVQCAFIVLRHVLTLPGLENISRSVSDGDLYDFLFDVANMYQSLNPYHNFQHAVDVMQATYYFLCQIGVLPPMEPDASPTLSSAKFPHGQYTWLQDNAIMKDLISPFDILALILASIGHDVGHPGVNNMFMIKTATPLALMYNDRSVLESFHAMVFFNILQRHCFRQLTEWRTTAQYTRFRRIVMRSILATDMGLHDDYVNKIQTQANRLKAYPLDIRNQEQATEEVLLICGSLIKCADISNCARPFPVAKKWAEILQHEFHEQGDLEKELGLSVLPMNERGKVSLEDFQLGFKKNVAGKLFEAVADVLPDMQYAVDYIRDNCVVWESRKQRSHDSGVGDEATSSSASSDYEMTGDRTTKVHDRTEVLSTPMNTQTRSDSSTGISKQPLDHPHYSSSRHCIINPGIQHSGQDQSHRDEPTRRRKKTRLLRKCILQ